MHIGARQLGRMTLAEVALTIEGWNEANGGGPGVAPPTDDEFDNADWDF